MYCIFKLKAISGFIPYTIHINLKKYNAGLNIN